MNTGCAIVKQNFFIYYEDANSGKITGICTILLAVVLICLPKKDHSAPVKKFRSTHIIFPTLIFFGSGLRDTAVKYVQQQYHGEKDQSFFLIFSFVFASAFGLFLLIIRLVTGKEQFNVKSIFAGIVIGIPAYFSFWCMITFLTRCSRQSAVVIPIHNMAIVILTTLVAVLLFKEKISIVNWLGIGFSIAGILFVALS